MKKILLIPLFFLIGACASTPTEFPDEQGAACYQPANLKDKKEYICLRYRSFSDHTKWHKVRSWEVLPRPPR